MPFNGSGTYSLPAGNPVVNNTVADSTVHNNTNSDLATALSNTLTKDGQSTPTANIPLGGFELTGVGDGSAIQSAATVKQLQNNGAITLSSVSGTDTITATASPVPSAYAAGQIFIFEPAATNTGAATINISSLGAKSVFYNGAAVAAGALPSGKPVVIRYDGTQFEIIAKTDFADLGSGVWAAPNGLTVNTDELVLDGSGNLSTSGNLEIEKTTPVITLTDNEDANSSDFSIQNTYVSSLTESNLRFRNGTDTRMVLTPAGSLLLGVSGVTGFGAADQQFIINGAASTRLEFGLSGSQTSGIFTNSSVYAIYTSGSVPMSLQTGGISRFEVDAGGTSKPSTDNTYSSGSAFNRWSVVYAATGTINTSDERQKTDFEEVPGLEFITRLKPYSYRWMVGSREVTKINDKEVIKESKGKRKHWGLMAQQVKSVLDELGVDFAGWVLADPKDPSSSQGLRYDQFVAPLVKSIIQQQQTIEELTQRIEKLENNHKG